MKNLLKLDQKKKC